MENPIVTSGTRSLITLILCYILMVIEPTIEREMRRKLTKSRKTETNTYKESTYRTNTEKKYNHSSSMYASSSDTF